MKKKIEKSALTLVTICLVSSSILLPTNFWLNYIKKRERKKDKLIGFPFFFLCCSCLVFFLFSYDLPPFFATFVFVFLLADASPFLLDFFLVAIISWSLYIHTIINDLLFLFCCSSGVSFSRKQVSCLDQPQKCVIFFLTRNT